MFTVDLKKTATDGTTELNGAKFTLTRFNGTKYVAYPDGNLTLGSKPVSLAAGSYELTETAAPDGYVVLTNRPKLVILCCPSRIRSTFPYTVPSLLRMIF